MDFKEAYIDKMICHRFSLDKQKCLINHKGMNMEKLDQTFLKDFFETRKNPVFICSFRRFEI